MCVDSDLLPGELKERCMVGVIEKLEMQKLLETSLKCSKLLKLHLALLFQFRYDIRVLNSGLYVLNC